MKKPLILLISVLLFTISNITAQTIKKYSGTIKENTATQSDSIVVKTEVWHGSTKKSAKLQINLLAYSPNGQERLLTFSNVVFGEDAPLNNVLANLANGDAVIENAPLQGATIKEYFTQRPELYMAYLQERTKIEKQLPK